MGRRPRLYCSPGPLGRKRSQVLRLFKGHVRLIYFMLFSLTKRLAKSKHKGGRSRASRPVQGRLLSRRSRSGLSPQAPLLLPAPQERAGQGEAQPVGQQGQGPPAKRQLLLPIYTPTHPLHPRIYTYTHTSTYRYTHLCTHTPLCVCICIYMPYIHTHLYTYIYL